MCHIGLRYVREGGKGTEFVGFGKGLQKRHERKKWA